LKPSCPLLFLPVGLRLPSIFVSSTKTFALGSDQRFPVISAYLHLILHRPHHIREQPGSLITTANKIRGHCKFSRRLPSKYRLLPCQELGRFLAFVSTFKAVSILSPTLRLADSLAG